MNDTREFKAADVIVDIEPRQFKVDDQNGPVMKGLLIPEGCSAKSQYMALRAQRTGLVLDQLAFYAPSDASVDAIKASLGLAAAEWTEDTVTGMATVWRGPATESKARLLFNYDLGIEVEILTYLEGPHWHQIAGSEKLNGPGWDKLMALPLAHSGFQSHIGFHVNNGDLPRLPFPVAQELVTHEHSNPAIAGRRYHYRIFDTRAVNGVFLKYIKRLS